MAGPTATYPYAAYAYTMSDGAGLGNGAGNSRGRPGRSSGGAPKHRRRGSTAPSEILPEAANPAALAYPYAAYPQYYYGYYNYAAPAWRY